MRSALLGLGIDKPGDASSARQLVSSAEAFVLEPAVMDALAGSATHRVREFVEHKLAVFGADLGVGPEQVGSGDRGLVAEG